ncbi:MAG TPA: helix-turn-helix domain-containing protein [Gemmatimonadales bacterium]|nr:helix-turn-helix domain-containing protein [Gemmatimonadales bacterium]
MGDPVHERRIASQRTIEVGERQDSVERRGTERRQSDHSETRPAQVVVGAEVLWTAADVARFLRVGRNRPYELVERGHLSCIWIGQRLRFDPAKVREFLERQSETLHLRRGGR